MRNQPYDIALPRPAVRDREGTAMLLHEALARSRQQEAMPAGQRHVLARRLAAGRSVPTHSVGSASSAGCPPSQGHCSPTSLPAAPLARVPPRDSGVLAGRGGFPGAF